MRFIQVLFAFACLAALASAARYAVLVAGSNGYYNYRHQADIFHAYQSLVGYGFEKENIITFAYDDIANSKSNPFPGQVFNKPTDPGTPGKDVYAGVKIDYSGADVTPQNFLDVLRGSETLKKQGKKVLESTSSDNVFIYFSDHGASGLIAFPSKYLYANDLISTLNWMSQNNKYSQLVFYLEACESGSMFEGLLAQNISIYATTAANAVESSWATYCSPQDRVNGKSIGSCLGDLYSVKFLENLDAVNPQIETLLIQYGILVLQTTASHVQRYGDISISNQVIGNFMANKNGGADEEIMKITEQEKTTNVDSRYVKLHYLANQHQLHQTRETLAALHEEELSIQQYDNIFTGLAEQFELNVNAPVKDIKFDCLKQRVNFYEDICGKFTDYGLKYVRTIQYTCAQGVSDVDFELAVLSACL
jgi:legumain